MDLRILVLRYQYCSSSKYFEVVDSKSLIMIKLDKNLFTIIFNKKQQHVHI